MKELLALQAQLNAALDLDKHETQVAPTGRGSHRACVQSQTVSPDKHPA
jgi:hypothetical protein